MKKFIFIMFILLMFPQVFATVKNVSFTYDSNYFNMTDGCKGEISFTPDNDDSFMICLYDGSYKGCKTYTSGEFNSSINLTTEYANVDVESNIQFYISWNRIRYVNMNNSALNGYNDSGDSLSSSSIGIYPECHNNYFGNGEYSFNDNDMTCSDSSNLKSYSGTGNYLQDGCVTWSVNLDNAGESYVPYSYSNRVYDGYSLVGGSNATGSCHIATSTVGNCWNINRSVLTSCSPGTNPTYPSSLCSYISSQNSFSNSFNLSVNDTISFSSKLYSEGTYTSELSEDTIVPYFTGNSTNNSFPKRSDSVNLSITIVDNIWVDTAILSWNCNNGIWQNISSRNVNSANSLVSFNATIPDTNIGSCLWKVYANDTYNNWNESYLSFLSLNTPYTENNFIADSYTLDLSSDGTNYGETSDGFNTGDSKIYTFYPISTARQQILIMRYTELDGSADIKKQSNGYSIGNIPASPAGSSDWKIKAFQINYSEMQSPLTINITAGTNTETLYIDWIALADIQNDSDGIVSENTFVIFYSNVSGTEHDYRGKVYNTSNDIINTFYDNNYTYSIDTEAGTNRLFIYQVDSNDGNWTYVIDSNSSGTWSDGINTTIEVDSTSPVINSVTTDLDFLVGNNYNISINITEKNDNYVNISVNDSSFEPYNLNSIGEDIWENNTLSFLYNSSKRITISAIDLVGHVTTYSYDVKASSIKTSITYRAINNTMNYLNYFNVSDTSSNKDLIFKSVFSNIAYGDAYIDDNNQSYYINDVNSKNIHTILNNNTVISHTDNSTNISWITDYWNNTNQSTYLFTNNIYWNVSEAVTLEWENTGVNNLRLFYINPGSNFNKSFPVEIFIMVPLRTKLNASTSVDLFECTNTINWGAKTCGSFSDITTQFYAQNNLTFHDTYNGNNYPTIDLNTSDNSTKDALIIKINISEERMFKIDLDTSNAEPTWTYTGSGSGDTSNDGGGGGDDITDDTVIDSGNKTITITLPKDDPWWKKFRISIPFLGAFGNFLSNVLNGFIGWIYDIYLTIKTGFSPTSTFILLTAITIISIIFILIGSPEQKGLRTKNIRPR